MTRATLALTAILVLAVPAAAARPAGRWIAFVSAEDDDRLVAVDLRTRRVLRRIPVADGPHNVSQHGGLVAVTSPPAGVVTLLDARTLRVLRRFRGLAYPHDVEFGGQWAWITEEHGGRVAVIDLVRRRIVGRVEVGSRPHDVGAGDGWAWVTHGPDGRALTLVVGPRRPRVARRFATRGPPHDIALDAERGRVYLTDWNSGLVTGLDTARRRTLFRRRVGTLTHHVQLTPSGRRLWVTDHVGGRVLALSAATGRTLAAARGCAGAHHVAPLGRRAVVACHDSGKLLLVSADGRTLASLDVGRGPHGVAVARVR